MELHEDETAITPPDCGLRERRRRETRRELADAALDLFERNGMAATTVDDIARLAGTSQRTFFRYFPSKEDAILADSDDAAELIAESIQAVRAGAPVVECIERNWLILLDRFDSREESRTRALRVWRLVGSEPALLARALRKEAEEVEELTSAAAKGQGESADILALRAAVATLTLVLRMSIEEWVRRVEAGEDSRVREIYRELRRGVATVARELDGDLPTHERAPQH